MTRRTGVLAGLGSCLLLAGCTDSPAERACLAAQRRAESHYGHLWSGVTLVVALVLSGYLAFGRSGLLPGPAHGLRLTATVGALALASLLFGLLGHVGGALYADHHHRCENTISFSGNAVVVLILLLVAAPLALLTLFAVGMVALGRRLYAGERSAVVGAGVVAVLPGVGAVSSLADGSSPYGWLTAAAAAAVVGPCAVLLLGRQVPATGVRVRAQPPPYPAAPPAAPGSSPQPERRPRPHPGARD